jgi:hypothetical protein
VSTNDHNTTNEEEEETVDAHLANYFIVAFWHLGLGLLYVILVLEAHDFAAQVVRGNLLFGGEEAAEHLLFVGVDHQIATVINGERQEY